ncbi:MAG: DegV family protein, partial [Lachnospiraceae bacterium]|nr:DegV family protein [Lachnospiraceae bacterium]
DRGMSAADIAAHLTSLTGKVSTSFVLDTLEFMWKGGRCTGVAALGANLLKIKPALEMHDGRLMIYKKYRGRTEKVYRQYIAERLAGKSIRPGHIFLTESGEIDPAVVEELTAYVKELSGAKEVHHTIAGCTISSHCGPRCLGVLFIEE